MQRYIKGLREKEVLALAKDKKIDMPQGPMFTKLVLFSLPLMASGMLQLLFNAADVIVVGRFAGEQSLAAVGSTGSLVTLIVNLFVGLASGTGAVIARYYGSRDDDSVRKCVHTAVLISLMAGVFLSLFGFFVSRPLLHLMGSPEDVIDKASLYLKIYFLGMPAQMFYNFGAAVLRAVGDTRRPLYFLTAAGVLNVGLNLVLVLVFHMDVAGVAIATVVSQVVSAVLVLLCLLKTDDCIHLDLRCLRIHTKQLKDMLRIGLPAGLQSTMFSISNVLIQSTINSFGSLVMAGNAAASNLEGFVYTAMNSMHHTATTFAAQNYGAGQYRRLPKVLGQSLILVTGVGIVLGGACLLFSNSLLGIYTDSAVAVGFGVVRLRVFSTYFLCGIMEVIAGQLRGVGYSVTPMISSLVFACFFRVGWVLWVVNPLRPVVGEVNALTLLYISYPVSWILTFTSHFITYGVASKKLKKEEKQHG